ncbi:MAG TPA: glycosyltransferase family 4 protein [Gammaproteobacteria bacterium]|nr:glycosyltransferase family 4 protein [Gammaproteobacteria bacterium]
MRILLITDNHTLTGGAEHYFFDLKEKLKKHAMVYSIGFGPQPAVGEDYFIFKSLTNHFTKLFWRFFVHPILYLRLRRLIKTFKPDVIHLHNIKQYPLTLLQAIKSYPTVQTTHDYSLICPTAQNLHKDGQVCPTGLRFTCFWQHHVKHPLLAYFLLTCCFFRIRHKTRKAINHYLAPSPLLADYLIKNQLAPVTYLPPFKKELISSPNFSAIKPQQFLFVGQLAAHKGIDLLLEEFAIACRQNPALKLVMAGSGAEEPRYRKKIAALGLHAQVQLVGWQQQSALERLYQEAIGVIFPSTGMESFGMVITESMGQARPVLGIQRGTSAWLVEDEETGLLFDPFQQGHLAEKILRLAGNLELAEKLGMGGFKKWQQWADNEAVLQQLLGVYESTLNIHHFQ